MGPVHLINETSLWDLGKRVEKKYSPEPMPDDIEISVRTMRANFVVEEPVAYEEDRWLDCRVGPLLWRLTGPAVRCESLTVDIDREQYTKSKEPYVTLCEDRSAPAGLAVLFGTYYTCDVLDDKREYEKCLPQELGYESFETASKKNQFTKRWGDKGDTFVRIYKTDLLSIREVAKGVSWEEHMKFSCGTKSCC